MKQTLERIRILLNTDFMLQVWVFLIYFIVAKASLYIYFTFETSPALIWPPVGIALAILILYGYTMWIPIFLAQFIAVTTEIPGVHILAFVIAAGYTLQGVVSLYILRKAGFDHTFPKVKHILLLIYVAIGATIIEPTIATTFQTLTGTLTISPFLNWGRAWGAGIFSVLVFTSFILLWYPWNKKFIPAETKKRIEIFAAFTLLICVNYYLFWTTSAQILGITLLFPLPATLIWFALRFHPRWLTLAILISAIQSIAGSILSTSSNLPLHEQLVADEIYIGLVAAIFYVFVNVVEERQTAYTKLEQSYQTAFASNKEKNEFIAILAHELRNPLAPIVGSLELLKLQPQSIQAIQLIESAQEHAVMMRRLLDDLLDTARLAQNKIKLRKETTGIIHLIEQSIASVQDYASSIKHNIHVILPPEDILLHADPIRIKQIIINLLNNACRYGKPGGNVELSCLKENEYLCITIKDDGVGIAENMFERIFEPFKQIESASQYSTGLGIGLFLTKRLTEMHGGKIAVQSEGPGKGSVFSIYIPLPLKPPSFVLDAVKPDSRKLSPLRILIVDDNQPAADILKKILELHSQEVFVSYSGKDALTALVSFKPQAILLDIGMPDMDGYEVARKIRSSGWNGIIIALSGYGQESDRQQSLTAGFNYHLIKPVDSKDILSVLKEIDIP